MKGERDLLVRAATILAIAVFLIWGVTGVGTLVATHFGLEWPNTSDEAVRDVCLTQPPLCADILAAKAAGRTADLTAAQLIVAVLSLLGVGYALFLNFIAATAATRQAAIALREFRYAERPWLEIAVIEDNVEAAFSVELNQTPWLKVKITNSGRGTAFFRESLLELSLQKTAPRPDQVGTDQGYYDDFGRLEPGQSTIKRHVALRSFEPQHYEATFFRNARVCFFGVLKYRDQRGNEWETGVCFEWMEFGDEQTGGFRRFTQYTEPPYYFDRDLETPR